MNIIMALPPWVRTLVILYAYVLLAAVPMVWLNTLCCVHACHVCPACGAVARWRVMLTVKHIHCRRCKTVFAVHHARRWQMWLYSLALVVVSCLWYLMALFVLSSFGPLVLVLIITVGIMCGCIHKRLSVQSVFATLNKETTLTAVHLRWWHVLI